MIYIQDLSQTQGWSLNIETQKKFGQPIMFVHDCNCHLVKGTTEYLLKVKKHFEVSRQIEASNGVLRYQLIVNEWEWNIERCPLPKFNRCQKSAQQKISVERDFEKPWHQIHAIERYAEKSQWWSFYRSLFGNSCSQASHKPMGNTI